MKDTWEMDTEELLHELGYDDRSYLYNEGWKMEKFIRAVDREIKKEAQQYISFLEDTEDDYYLKLKNGEIERDK